MKTSMLRTLAALLVVFAMLASLAACGGNQNLVSFKVNFIVEGEVYDTLHIEGMTIELPDNPPAKEGYRFVGWYWDDGVWEKPFNAQSLANASLADEMYVYAKFEPIPTTPGGDTPAGTYMIVFMVDGQVYDSRQTDGTTITFPQEPAKDGYRFAGWYWDDGAWTRPFDAASLSDTVLSEVMSVYAKFELIQTPPAVDPELPADGSTLTIPEFNAIAADVAANTFTTQKYLVTGTVVEIVSTMYGNLYLEDAEGNRLYVYGVWNTDGTVRFDALETQPRVGDTLTLLGIAGNYNGTVEMKNAWIKAHTPGEVDPPVVDPELPADGSTLTIPAFNEIAAAQPDKGETTTQKYFVTGTVTEIVNTMYGNLYIVDEEGNTLYIYGVYSEDGTVRFDSMATQPKVGDTITVLGVACNYNGAQMKNGWVTAIVPGEGGDITSPVEPEAVDLATLEENVAYRLYVDQINLGDCFYMTGTVQSGKYIAGTTDPLQAGLVYVEKVEGGICLYGFNAEGARVYLTASVTATADGKTSRALGFATEGGAVWYVNANNILCTEINGLEYAIGTYGEYSTISISASSYYTADAIGISQFPIQFTYA